HHEHLEELTRRLPPPTSAVLCPASGPQERGSVFADFLKPAPLMVSDKRMKQGSSTLWSASLNLCVLQQFLAKAGPYVLRNVRMRVLPCFRLMSPSLLSWRLIRLDSSSRLLSKRCGLGFCLP